MNDQCSQLWQKVSAALKPHVSADTYKRWFSALELVEADDNALVLRVPNNIYQFWIESNHMTALQGAIMKAIGEPRDVKFVLPSGSAVDGDVIVDAIPDIAPQSDAESRSSRSAPGLNPRNTFESFVVGPNNQIAHAACLAVAQAP